VTVERPWDVTVDATSEYSIQSSPTHYRAKRGGQAGALFDYVGDFRQYSRERLYVQPRAHRCRTGQDNQVDYGLLDSRVASVSPNWTTTPDNTSAYKILPVGLAVVESFTAAA